MRKLVLILVFCVSAFALDFEVKTEMLECYKSNKSLVEKANIFFETAAKGKFQGDKSYETVSAIPLIMHAFRDEAMNKCGILIKKEFISANESYDKTTDLISELMMLSITFGMLE